MKFEEINFEKISEKANEIKSAMGGMIKADPKNLKIVGIRFYIVNEETEMLMENAFYVKNFNPEDWD
jgi:hypothetical protein